MRRKMILFAMFLCSCMAFGQNDPVVMTVNGRPVSRSEFEYSYNKNNTEGVIDRKSVAEYADLFARYKMKVQAALDAGIDTTAAFKEELATYRDQQIYPILVTDADIMAEAHRIYDATKEQIGERGLVSPSHILIHVKQNASEAEDRQAKIRIDSIYTALKEGADFAELAQKLSQDPGSASRGGDLGFVRQGVMVKEFEDQMFALEKGEMSKPFQSPFGYHIILMKDKKAFEPFEYHKADILRFIEARNIRDYLAEQAVQKRVESLPGATREGIMGQIVDSLCVEDVDLKYLLQEYHDGLLLYEIMTQEVWNKASNDKKGQEEFFKKNKKKYNWSEPRFKGIAYRTQRPEDVKAVKACVKGIPFSSWAEKLASTFNNDSIIRVRAEKGIFEKGRNSLVDKEIFKATTTVEALDGYPYTGVYGKLLKKGPEEYEDVRPLVLADYQDFLEEQWMEDLRKKYEVKIFKDVLETVNQH